MIKFNQDPDIVQKQERISIFKDDEESIDISHKSMCANMVYIGIDTLIYKLDNIDLSDQNSICNLNKKEIYDYVLSSADYIKTIAANGVCREHILTKDNVDTMLKYYTNNVNIRTYSCVVLNIKKYIEGIARFDLKQLDRYIIQLASVYYIGETKSEQHDIVENVLNYIKDDLYCKKSFNDHFKNYLSIISPCSLYKTSSNSIPFNCEEDIYTLLSGDIEGLLNNLNPYIKQFYQSKIYADIIKGKIVPGRSNIETMIIFVYYLFTITIETYIKNIREALNIAENLYEGYLNPAHPIYESDVYDNNYKEYAIRSYEAIDGDDKSGIKVNENYKKKNEEFYKIYLSTVKLAKYNISRFFSSKFFKKYYGRIPSLYERYGSEAKVAENKLTGDPTMILKESGVKYIQDMTKDATDLFNEIIQMSNKVASSDDFNAKLSVIKSYCKRFPISGDADYKIIDDCIRNETIHRIASSILQNVKIYGYSIEGIVENGKFPPANHIVTSIFTDNPHEKPEPISVTDIFSSPDNILIYAKPDLGNFFNDVYKKTSNLLMSGLNIKGISNTSNLLEKSANNYKMNVKRGLKNGDIEKNNVNGEKVGVKMINKGLEQSIELVWNQKRRCLQCISVMLDMTGRIILLAKKCVIAMLTIEREMKDSSHNTGFKSENVNKTHSGVAKNVGVGLKKANASDEDISRYKVK